jgi:ketosteroid isomerase-like protein
LDRLEAFAEIRQLVARYALALDSRDLDALVDLYVDDVRVTRTTSGRDALRAAFDESLRTFRTSVHFVGNHVIELDGTDDERAHGTVYCRAEHEVVDREAGEQWVVVPLLYDDDYEWRGEQWFFRRRKILVWYETDVLTQPASERRRRWPGRPATDADLPGAWETWHRFWKVSDVDLR